MAAGLSAAEGQVKKSTEAMSAKLAGIGKAMTTVGKTMTVIGGSITAAFGLIIKRTVDAGDAFNDMSLRTGVAVETLSALDYAGKQTGTSIDAIETSLKFLTRAMDDTSKGIGTAKDTFTALGISVTDTEGKLRPTVEVMKDVATAIAAIDDPTKQAAIAMELFGARSGTELVPLLKLGETGIESLMQKAKELGIVLSTEDARAADEFKDKMNDLKEVLGAAARSLANVLIPSLAELSVKAVEFIKKIREWADAHKPLVEMIVKVGATLGVLAAVGGPILMAVGAFMNMKIAMLAVSAFSNGTFIPSMVATKGAITGLGTASSGPIGIAIVAIEAMVMGVIKLCDYLRETVGGMRDFREGLNKMTLFEIDTEINKLTDSIKQLQDTYSDKKLTPESYFGQAALTMIDEYGKRLEMLKDKKEGLTEIADATKGLGEQFVIAGERLDEFGNKIETFDEWVARLAEETKTANEAIAASTKALADTMQPIYDRLYEMNHTAEEIAVRNLNAQRDAQIEAVNALNLSIDARAAALAKITELYNIEVNLIIAKIEEEKEAKKKEIETTVTGELAKMTAIREGIKPYDELIAKVNEVAGATEESAARQVRALRTVTDAAGNVTLTNLAPQQSAGSYAEAQAIVAANAAKPTTTPAAIPTVTPSIPTPYVPNQTTTNVAGGVTSIKLPGGGTISIGTKSYQLGTPYVPKTGLYQLHQGEAVIPKNQNTTNNNSNSFSPSVVVNVSGGGNASNIAYEVKKVLDESIRQFRRSGFELVPGRG